MTDSLALIDRARLALSEARTLDEVKDVRDLALAAQHFARARKGAEESERYANEIRLRAERRLGEITREMEKAAGGRPSKTCSREEQVSTKSSALEAAGLTRKDAHVFEAVASIPAKVFEAEVVKPEASTARLARMGREVAKADKPPPPAPRNRMFNAEVTAGMLADHIQSVVDEWPEDEPLLPLLLHLEQLVKQIRRIHEKRRETA